MIKNIFNSNLSKVALVFISGLFLCSILLSNLIFNIDNINEKPHIAVLIPGSVVFFDLQKVAMKKTAGDLGYQITFFNADWDPIVQIQQLQNALSMGANAIALASVDNQALTVAPRLVAQQKIPLVTFTNAIGSDPYGFYPNVVAHVGRDEIQAGELLAKEIELLREQKSTSIFFIQGSAGTAPQRQREIGFLNIAAQHANWKIIANKTIPEWDSRLVEIEIQKLYNSGKKIDVIATEWAGAAVSAAHIINNHKKKIGIVSLEFNSAIQMEMLKGSIDYSTYFSIAEEGEKTIKTIAKILKNQTIERFVAINQTIIDKSQASHIKVEY